MTELKKKDDDKEIKEQESEVINLFGREQFIYTCQYCSKRILTEIETESTWIGIAISFLLLLIFNLPGVILVAILLPLTRQTNHYCTNCKNKVGVCSFYDMISMSDRIISWNVGEFAILITRKQLIGAFVFILFSLIFYVFFVNINFERGNFIDETYEDFINKCGYEKYITNPSKTNLYCQSKYRFSDVSWNGYVVRVDYEDHFFARHRLSLLMKMDKNSTETSDIYLKFSDTQYENFKDTIFNIKRGDKAKFNATILWEGDSRSSAVLECFGFDILNEHINIEPHIHHTGRYSVGHDTIHKNDSLYYNIPDLISDEEKNIEQNESYH